MKTLIVCILLSFSIFAKFTDQERVHVRQLAKDHCQTRGGIYSILFDIEKPLAKVFCKNGESIVFYLNRK